MKNTQERTISDKIIEGLNKAITEMEELRIQVALGKAEARDLYEESKKNFKHYIREANNELVRYKNSAAAAGVDIKKLLENLQVQLALGKAETKEAFKEQKQIIIASLHNIENAIQANKTVDEFYSMLLMEIKKFRIKLDIIALHYELKKLNSTAEFNEKKKEFISKLDEFKAKALGIKSEKKHDWDNFKDEIAEAYQHLRNVFAH